MAGARSARTGWRDFGVRAAKTFVQGVTGTLLASGITPTLDASIIEAALIGGLAAVVSLLNNWASAIETPGRAGPPPDKLEA